MMVIVCARAVGRHAAGNVRACLRAPPGRACARGRLRAGLLASLLLGLVAPGLIQINLAAGITSRVSLYIATTLVIHNFNLRRMPLWNGKHNQDRGQAHGLSYYVIRLQLVPYLSSQNSIQPLKVYLKWLITVQLASVYNYDWQKRRKWLFQRKNHRQ